MVTNSEGTSSNIHPVMITGQSALLVSQNTGCLGHVLLFSFLRMILQSTIISADLTLSAKFIILPGLIVESDLG